MDKVDRFIASQKKILAKLEKTRNAAQRVADSANKAAEKAHARYDDTRHLAALDIAKMRGISYYAALELVR